MMLYLLKLPFLILDTEKQIKENIQQESHLECSPVPYILADFFTWYCAEDNFYAYISIFYYSLYQRKPLSSATLLHNYRVMQR